jgi:tyrosyl-tRNA synthetase
VGNMLFTARGLTVLTLVSADVCHSGRMHIAQGVLRAINVNKLTSTGCMFKFWVADWFAQLNNKMDGDLKKIRMIGQYMIEIWKAIGK